jgi:arylsulfatase A-like enzyme
MYGLASEYFGFTLDDYSKHLANYLRQHGYTTAVAGTNHVARKPWHDIREEYDRALNLDEIGRPRHEATVERVKEYLDEPRTKPFFLAVGIEEPHRNNPHPAVYTSEWTEEPEDIDPRYCQPFPHLPNNDTTRREMANYKQGVEIMDRKMGEVLNALEEAGLADNTLVICTTDHGPGMTEMKCTLTDRGTGVMLILRGPKDMPELRGGRVTDELVSQLDLYPTVCDLLEIPKPDWLQGVSLAPMLRGGASNVREEVFTEQNWHANYRPLRAIRTRRHKYIRRFNPDEVRGVDEGPAERMLNEYGYRERPHPKEELYDLIFDPNEANNLVESAEHQDVLSNLRARLMQWMAETGDALLQDGIPEPPAWFTEEFKNRRPEGWTPGQFKLPQSCWR